MERSETDNVLKESSPQSLKEEACPILERQWKDEICPALEQEERKEDLKPVSSPQSLKEDLELALGYKERKEDSEEKSIFDLSLNELKSRLPKALSQPPEYSVSSEVKVH